MLRHRAQVTSNCEKRKYKLSSMRPYLDFASQVMFSLSYEVETWKRYKNS